MSYYPIQLDIRGRNCLVVGGGGVGTRKVKSLLACGAQVTVVSPAVTDNLRGLAARATSRCWKGNMPPATCKGCFW